MTEKSGALSQTIIDDTNYLLFIGKVKEKQRSIGVLMQENYTDYQDLCKVIKDAPAGSSPKERREHAISAVAAILGGQREEATFFVDFEGVGELASNLYQAMLVKKYALENNESIDAELVKELDAKCERNVAEIKAMLPALTESPKFVCGIAVDSYVKTLGHHLGLKEHTLQLP